MWTAYGRSLSACLELFLPPACLLCGERLAADSGGIHLCCGCLASITPPGPAHCTRCAQPFPKATSEHLCGTCLEQPPVFTAVHPAGLYQGGLQLAITRLKYHNQWALAKPLGQLLGSRLDSGFLPDCVVPVPLHADRLRQRGFNQSLEIARPLARRLRCPLNYSLLQRTRPTPAQQGLSAAERRRNLRLAFALTARADGLRILLVDDVMTTGETVRECCRTLQAGGAQEIQVAVAGRA